MSFNHQIAPNQNFPYQEVSESERPAQQSCWEIVAAALGRFVMAIFQTIGDFFAWLCARSEPIAPPFQAEVLLFQPYERTSQELTRAIAAVVRKFSFEEIHIQEHPALRKIGLYGFAAGDLLGYGAPGYFPSREDAEAFLQNHPVLRYSEINAQGMPLSSCTSEIDKAAHFVQAMHRRHVIRDESSLAVLYGYMGQHGSPGYIFDRAWDRCHKVLSWPIPEQFKNTWARIAENSFREGFAELQRNLTASRRGQQPVLERFMGNGEPFMREATALTGMMFAGGLQTCVEETIRACEAMGLLLPEVKAAQAMKAVAIALLMRGNTNQARSSPQDFTLMDACFTIGQAVFNEEMSRLFGPNYRQDRSLQGVIDQFEQVSLVGIEGESFCSGEAKPLTVFTSALQALDLISIEVREGRGQTAFETVMRQILSKGERWPSHLAPLAGAMMALLLKNLGVENPIPQKWLAFQEANLAQADISVLDETAENIGAIFNGGRN